LDIASGDPSPLRPHPPQAPIPEAVAPSPAQQRFNRILASSVASIGTNVAVLPDAVRTLASGNLPPGLPLPGSLSPRVSWLWSKIPWLLL